MARIVTHAELCTVPDGGAYYLEDGAELTPLAAERARARGIAVHRGVGGGGELAGLQELTKQVVDRLGGLAPEAVDLVVAEVMAALQEGGPGNAPLQAAGLPPSADYCAAYIESERHRSRRRAVITTTGRNQKGVVASLTAVIAELGGDILDISQTLVGDYFTMLLIVDIGELTTAFADFKDALLQAANARGVQAIVMHEDMVSSMHRV